MLLKTFKQSASTPHEVTMKSVQTFTVQLILTLIAMCSCVIDGFANMITDDYSVKIIFFMDCAVNASCNFAMIKVRIISRIYFNLLFFLFYSFVIFY